MKKQILNNLSALFVLGIPFVVTVSPSVIATENITVDAVLAVETDADYGEYLAAECMTCHTGSNTNASIPDINSRESAYIVSALLEYKYNKRDNETMRLIAGALGKEEIAALTAYFNGLGK